MGEIFLLCAGAYTVFFPEVRGVRFFIYDKYSQKLFVFNYLIGVQKFPVPDFIHNNRNNIDIKYSSNGFNPYIIVADDVSFLGFLTLF